MLSRKNWVFPYLGLVIFIFVIDSLNIGKNPRDLFDIVFSLLVLVSTVAYSGTTILRHKLTSERRIIDSFIFLYSSILLAMEIVSTIAYCALRHQLFLDNFSSFVIIWSVTTILPLAYSVWRIITERKFITREVVFLSSMVFVVIETLLTPTLYQFFDLNPTKWVKTAFILEYVFMQIFVFLAILVFSLENAVKRVFSGIMLITISVLEFLTLIMTYSHFITQKPFFYEKILLYKQILYITLLFSLSRALDRKFIVKSFNEIVVERDNFRRMYQVENKLLGNFFEISQLIRHDLIGDVTVVKSFIELYKETNEKRFLEKVESRVKGIERKLDDFKIDKEFFEIKPVNLTILNSLSDVFEDLEIKIPNHCVVSTNIYILNFIYNLVNNAYQHNADMPDLKVTLAVKCDEENAIIQVIDNGKGVPDKLKNKIFQKDFKGKESTGQGLALYLIKRQIEKIGGKIEVLDNIPHGAIFQVILPRTEENNKKKENNRHKNFQKHK